MKINNLAYCALLMGLLFSACKGTNVSSSTDAFAPLNSGSVSVDYLSLRSRVKYNSPDFSISSSATVRMKQDSVIWVSLAPALGIEMARALITRDTLLLLDKMNKEVLTYNFDLLSKQLNFPVTFDLVQAAILGNLPRPATAADFVSRGPEVTTVTQDWGRIEVANTIANGTMKVSQIHARELGTPNQMMVTYDEFKTITDFLFAHNGLISLQYLQGGQPTETTIEISHNRVDVSEEPLDFPFSIPDRYDIR